MKTYTKRFSWKRVYRQKVKKETRDKISRVAHFIMETIELGIMFYGPLVLAFFGWLFWGY